jgi:glycosyltransferase involved in cell wall biosynthesis
MQYCFITYGSWENNAGFIRLRHLGSELARRDVGVTYVVDDVPYNHEPLKAMLHPSVRIAYVSPHRGLGQIKARRRVLQSVAPDYIHLLNSHAKSVTALAGWKHPKIVADWDEPPTLRPLGFARLQIEHAADRWLRKNAHVRISCTTYLQRRFRDNFAMETVYIPHAPYFTDQPEAASPFTEPTAVYMGTLYPAWDHDILFDAARLMRQAGSSPRIALLGDGPQRQKWHSFIEENKLDNFILSGYLTGADLWRHLRHAHVLLFPIRDTILNRARCPSKIFAYAQAKRPLITNRVGELPELLGETPIYIGESPQDFANAISRAMAEPARPDVEYRLESHNWSDRADRLLEAIRAAG